MGIKTKLKLIGLLPLLMAVVFGVTAYRGHESLRELRDLTVLADGMQDQVEQLESAIHRFVETRADRFRQETYLLLDSLEIQAHVAGHRFESPSAPELVADLRKRLVQSRWSFMQLDALYLPALTAFEITRLQQAAQRIQIEISRIKPLLHRLHHDSHRTAVAYSDTLWTTEFILIVVTAILVLSLMAPVLYRVATALHILGRGTRELGQGGIPPRLVLPGKDEFSRLAADFNQMSQRLAEAEAVREKRATELENAVQDLENFSYSVSHDLRAPLRAIDGFVAILKEEYAPQLDVEGLRLFGVVSANAKKMEQLINDILALSRAGRLELDPRQVDMNTLVREVWTALSEQQTARAIQFQCADLPEIFCDPRAIRQVWQNLLDNAIKFTQGRDPAVIEVGAERRAGMIRYTVRDNGAGFDPTYADKLFGLFLRLHGMDEFAGTGVGLAIVKRFVQKHNGAVDGTGEIGVGATFSFSLPVERIESCPG
ncbi:sensor histidine kinase [Thiocystis violascens]|uniref:histidine kinase n=1 Tax=Thiocystis violascens (strain ATCC 17096 / DSM 198 / 6111) TaxID=765911 RepID=I3YAT0_THIV6|nr:ATP-binding protein [Thiocystis violascens]AFL74098.1 bacteriophytochrome (light-regulated signal transduction histidine kinase) [Thiocystis violascens DSM 198]